MRKIIFPLMLSLLLFFILFIGYGTYYYLATSAEELLTLVQPLEDSIKQEYWQKASSSYLEVKEKWEAMYTYWPMLIDHQEMDRIEESIAKLEGYLYSKNQSLALAELYALMHYINHIPKKEIFNLKNIF